VAKAVQELGLHYAVITSVTRDDLEDGGADQFVQTIREIRALSSDTRIEILVPDFQGNPEAIERVCSARPDMFNHNLETVARLYPLVRPQARYNRSLHVLSYAAGYGLPTKSGLMLGLGESKDEVLKALEDLRKAGCEHLTLGQYLSPSRIHVPVSKYVTPEEFEEWSSIAGAMGFKGVASGPLVRSSYRAEDFFHSQNCTRIESKSAVI
jgi:lipoic acid synthetase